MAWPAVSVVLPCRNEGEHIESVLRSILHMDPPDGGFEVVVADGRSDDGTLERVEAVAQDYPDRVRVIQNDAGIVSTGLNAAIRAARGQFIVRMDAHTWYASDYLVQCLRVHGETGADTVGGPWVAQGRGRMGRAVALSFASPLSTGGGAAHAAGYEGPVDTVYLGAWNREVFERIGAFDEELVRNQDDELNLRIVRAGGVVWQSPAIRSEYQCRSSLGELIRQFYQYGYWKVRVIQKHRLPASVRHVVPALALLGAIAAVVLAPMSTAAATALGAAVAIYILAILAATMACAGIANCNLWPAVAATFPCYHFGYAVGFLHGLVDFVWLNRAPRRSAVTLSRTSLN
jgi:glycosyltransferase involved in cell wall biosynthesis